MPNTIKDIAKKAGVSHTTVSRALHGSSLISPETAERIRHVAIELDYKPSAAARSLRTNRTTVLGVIVNNIADPFFSEILYGIEETAQAAGYSLFIAASQHDPNRERQIVQTMMEQRTDGVIICSSSFSAEQGNQLLSYGFPIVVVNHQSAEHFNYSIYHDDVDGSRQITRHLIQLGHRRIAYLGNSRSGRTTLDRLSGYRTEMEIANMPILDGYIVHVPGGEPQLGFDIVQTFLHLDSPPTAIVCFNDMLAIGALKGCIASGLRVPQDMSITGFDNITYSAFTCPSLTTFDQPKRSIGKEAAQLLLDLLARDRSELTEPPRIKVLKGSLLERESSSTPNH